MLDTIMSKMVTHGMLAAATRYRRDPHAITLYARYGVRGSRLHSYCIELPSGGEFKMVRCAGAHVYMRCFMIRIADNSSRNRTERESGTPTLMI